MNDGKGGKGEEGGKGGKGRKGGTVGREKMESIDVTRLSGVQTGADNCNR